MEAESKGIERKRTGFFPWWVIALFVACFLAQLFFQTQVVQFKTEYDHDRNIIVARELAETGILSYLGRAYAINPPLYYAIHAAMISIFGFSYFIVKFTELSLFFLGSVLVYFITRRVFGSRKAGLLAFILSGALTWTSLYASAVRSYSSVFLFGALLIYAYLRFLEKQSWIRAIISGAVFGLCMLTKESFIFLGLALALHFLIFSALINDKHVKNYGMSRPLILGIIAIVVSLAVYLPWIYYLSANHLTMPWDIHVFNPQVSWASQKTGWNPGSVLSVFAIFFQNWPVMLSCAFIMLALKAKSSIKKSLVEEPALWAVLFALFIPLLTITTILIPSNLHQYFFIFAPLPIISAGLVFGKKNIIGSGYLRLLILTALILSAIIMSIINIPQLTMPVGDFTNEDSRKFMNALTPADTVAGEWYSTMNVFTKAYAEYFPSATPQPGFFLVNGVDYYMRSGPFTNDETPDYLEYFTTFHAPPMWGEKSVFVYRVNKTALAGGLGLECAGMIKVERADGSPARQAQVTVSSKDSGWSIPYISGNDGSVDVFIPQGSSGSIGVQVKAIGFKEYSGTLKVPPSLCDETQSILLSPTSKFFHGFNESRY